MAQHRTFNPAHLTRVSGAISTHFSYPWFWYYVPAAWDFGSKHGR